MKKKVNIKNINKRKTMIILLIIIIFIIALMCFLIKNDYKNKNFGNNMSNKNLKEIEEYILNISSYEAKMKVTVESNKNTNKYVLKQTYEKDKISKQEVIEPKNIEGTEIIYEKNILKINQTKLNLNKIYENYNYLIENFLWLDSFIDDYKETNESNIIVENNIVIMETKTKNKNNKYVSYKQLFINKNTGKPTKMIIKDINKKELVYILYNEITVNGL